MESQYIGQQIGRYLEERGMSQKQLAELTGITAVTISRYISGKREPGAKNLGKIAQALKCSSDMLLGIKESSQSQYSTAKTYIMENEYHWNTEQKLILIGILAKV